MAIYVAFLRGINVGGNNIIRMDALRAEFERMGFESVRTYIQSGNVLFESAGSDKAKLEKKIEQGLKARFKYEARVLIRSKKDIESAIAHFPQVFGNPAWKHNVIFLSAKIDSKGILKGLDAKKGIEQVTYSPGVLFWSADWDKIGRSSMLKLSSKKEYQEMTVRNVNTTRKILELMG